MAIRVRSDGTTTNVNNVASKGITIVKRVTVGKPVRKVNTAVVSIDNLSGVDTSGVQNEYILQYNSTSQKWEAVENEGVGGSETLVGLTDVDAATRVAGSILVYNETSEKFETKTVLEEQTINGGQY
jgi:hypothetical protein